MILAVGELQKFVGLNALTVDEKHRQALREWLDFHESERNLPIDDYTVYTVIQQKLKNGKLRKLKCNLETGEVIEGGD